MKRVTGVGGILFKSENPPQLLNSVVHLPPDDEIFRREQRQLHDQLPRRQSRLAARLSYGNRQSQRKTDRSAGGPPLNFGHVKPSFTELRQKET